MSEIIDSFSTFFGSQDFKTSITVFKVLFILLAIVFIALGIYLKTKAGFYSERFLYYSYYLKKAKKPDQASTLPLAELKVYWQQLGMKLNVQNEAQWKLAVIEADNFFDHVLTLLGYQGESMGERLQKVLPEHLPNINDVWRVHKVRNSLVHDATFRLSYNQARDVYDTYEKALKQLKIL